jgi:hypothetical protein
VDRTDTMPAERITPVIRTVRGVKVILDAELAVLYGVTTRRLNEQVKRNGDRFLQDFLLRLTAAETEVLNRSQILRPVPRSTAIRAIRRLPSPSMAPSWLPRSSAVRGLSR